MARLLFDQIEGDEAQIAGGEHAANAEIVSEAAPVAAAETATAAGSTPAAPAAPADRFHPVPGPVHVPVGMFIETRHNCILRYILR